MRLRSRQTRLVLTGVAALVSLPLGLGRLSGLYLWSSPLVLLDAVMARQRLGWLHLIAGAVLLIALFRHRWYCRWLCPAGALCDLVSKGRPPASRLAGLPRIGGLILAATVAAAILGAPLLSIIDPVNLFTAFFDVFRRQTSWLVFLKASGLILVLAASWAVPNIWCGKVCPLGSLQDSLSRVRRLFRKEKSAALSFSSGRRVLLGALLGVGVKLGLGRAAGKKTPSLLRPPGALEEEKLEGVCIRCGNCGRACPTGIVTPAVDTGNVAGLLTPAVEFNSGYCLPECVACGSVCPTGAIRKFSVEDKQRLVMGVARIETGLCLLTRHKECDQCLRYCDYKALRIVRDAGGLDARVEVIVDKCVGCGACVVICPAAAVEVEPVS
ncbi:4Fe-4S binding protein [bacterium]|nr:4Fe-4S binding protein [bacterium]